MEKNQSVTSVLKKMGVSYLAMPKQSSKMKKSYEHGTLTYCLYLAPSNMSGYNVCPNDAYCKKFCLNGSGHNKLDIMAHGIEHSKINNARIKKTRFLKENKEEFMFVMINEIKKYQKQAKDNNLGFSVRINGTSDLDPREFTYHGKNILEIFPDIQFYDYTKVYNRRFLAERYDNYDVTLSYNGYNWKQCEEYLRNGGKVAVVFEGGLPTEFKGFKVVNGNEYDMRYLDPKGTIIGLSYHKVANDYVNGKYVRPKTKFVVLV